jgi:hypothetical protein
MVWGCMSWAGVGDACEIEGRIDGNYYVNDILQKYIIPSRDYLDIPEDDFIFQQDNATVHTT